MFFNFSKFITKTHINCSVDSVSDNFLKLHPSRTPLYQLFIKVKDLLLYFCKI